MIILTKSLFFCLILKFQGPGALPRQFQNRRDQKHHCFCFLLLPKTMCKINRWMYYPKYRRFPSHHCPDPHHSHHSLRKLKKNYLGDIIIFFIYSTIFNSTSKYIHCGPSTQGGAFFGTHFQ